MSFKSEDEIWRYNLRFFNPVSRLGSPPPSQSLPHLTVSLGFSSPRTVQETVKTWRPRQFREKTDFEMVVSQLIDWLIECPQKCDETEKLIDWLIDWVYLKVSRNWKVDWLIDWLIDWYVAFVPVVTRASHLCLHNWKEWIDVDVILKKVQECTVYSCILTWEFNSSLNGVLFRRTFKKALWMKFSEFNATNFPRMNITIIKCYNTVMRHSYVRHIEYLYTHSCGFCSF